MTFEQLLITFLAIVALSYSIQAVAILVIASKATRSLDSAVSSVEKLTPRIEEALKLVSDNVGSVKGPLVRGVESVEKISQEFGGIVDQVRKTGQTIDEAVELTRARIEDWNKGVMDALDQMQTTTAEVQKAVLRPSAEIAAVVKGVRGGVQELIRRRR